MEAQSVTLDLSHAQHAEQVLVFGVDSLQAHPSLEAILLRRERLMGERHTHSLVPLFQGSISKQFPDIP